MEQHLYMLRDLKATRALEEGDDLSDLDFMKEVGPHKMNPLVIEGNVIIDGVRRFHKAQQMGWDYLYAVKPEDVYEATEALALNHTEPLKRWDHVVEIINYLRRLNKQRVADRRIGKTSTLVPIRDLMSQALGGLSSGQFEKVSLVMDEPDLVHRIRAGSITPAGAYAILMKRGRRVQEGIEDPTEQLEIYQKTNRQLRIIAESLKKIGPVALTREEAYMVSNEFKAARNALNILMRRLEEAFKNER